MKRIGNLYEKIYAIENIRLAHKNASKGKKKYKEVIEVENNKEFYFEKIQKMLKEKTFKNSPYFVFKRKFGNKEREIYKLPYFPDRIIHHCIVQILEPIWVKIFIKDTYSSIKNRGIHSCLKRVKKVVKDKKYCLKIDIKKFYPSINNTILKTIIRKKIKCNDTLNLLDIVINSVEGIPIGNYLSQFFGNLYLTYFDHFAKEELKCENYFRYCDDMIFIHNNKKFLKNILFNVIYYLNKLKLIIRNNWQIFHLKRGIDFLGYRIFNNYCLLRKTIAKKFKDTCNDINYLCYLKDVSSIMSYKGWMKFANCFNLYNTYTKLGV